jgi:hypothetical protein
MHENKAQSLIPSQKKKTKNPNHFKSNLYKTELSVIISNAVIFSREPRISFNFFALGFKNIFVMLDKVMQIHYRKLGKYRKA